MEATNKPVGATPETGLRLSASSIEKFCTCPKKYKFHYDDRIPEGEPTAALIHGSLVHAAIAILTAKRATSKGAHGPSDRDLIHSAILEAAKQEEITDVDAMIDAIIPVEKWWNHPIADGVTVLVDGEELLEPLEPGITVIGLPDAIRRNGTTDTIIDYKTGRTRYTQEDVQNSPQLFTYAWLWRKYLVSHPERRPANGVMPNIVVRYEQVSRGEIVSFTPTENDYEKIEAFLKYIALRIQSGERDAKPGFYCRWCPYLKLCAEGQVQTGTRTSTSY